MGHRPVNKRQKAQIYALSMNKIYRDVIFFLCVLTSILLLAILPARANSTSLDIPQNLKIKNTSHAQTINFHPAILGSSEQSASDISEFVKWTGMFKKLNQHMNQGSGAQHLYQIKSKIAPLQNQDLYSQAQAINKMMNAKRYITDQKNYGTSDYWASPAEFMQRGGDCEDFAIAKYTALRMLGTPESRLRIAIVQDTLKNIAHAILIVYTDQGPIILDNQNKSITSAQGKGRYQPIFSINRNGWWLHKAKKNTKVTRINVAAK